MSDLLDQKIKELFVELDAVAPNPPPAPHVPSRAGGTIWVRGVAVAGAAAALVLVLGVATQLVFVGNDSADEPASVDGAPATTQVFSETTFVAEAADTTGPSADSRPTENVLTLATLNLACSTFAAESATAVLSAPGSPQEYSETGIALGSPISDLVGTILSAETELENSNFGQIVQLTEQLVADVGGLAEGIVDNPAGAYQQMRFDFLQLGTALEDYGALDCGDLATGLP